MLKVNLITENETEIYKAKELTHTLILILKETAQINNFWTDKKAEQKNIAGRIEDEIRYSRIEGLPARAAELTTELMRLAKNREENLK